LPSYQEAMLEFLENTSQELQTVLNDFKSCHHHQYRIKSEAQEDEENSEEPESSLATTYISGSEDDDVENSDQPLLDLALSDDQTSQTEWEENLNSKTPTMVYADSSYQAVDSFSQLKTVQMESFNKQETGSDGLTSLTDDTTWSKSLLSSSVQTAADEVTTDLHLLKINSSVPLIPAASSTVTSHVTPVTSSSSVSVLHSSLRDHTSLVPKLQDNWDDLFADLDPLSNEKV